MVAIGGWETVTISEFRFGWLLACLVSFIHLLQPLSPPSPLSFCYFLFPIFLALYTRHPFIFLTLISTPHHIVFYWHQLFSRTDPVYSFMANPSVKQTPPLAGRPPFATDEPDSVYENSPSQQTRRMRQPKPEERPTSAYNVWVVWISKKNSGLLIALFVVLVL